MMMNNPDMKNKLLLLIALACGLLAALVGYSFLKGEQQKYNAQIEEVKEAAKKNAAPPIKTYGIIMASKDISAGTTITSELVGVKELPEQYIQQGAIPASQNVLGMTASVDIFAGEQIVKQKLGEVAKPKLISDITPPGKRAVPLIVDNINSLMGLLHPGDYVDVLAVITPPQGSALYSLASTEVPSANSSNKPENKVTIPLFQNVLVLAMGNDMNSSAAKKAPVGAPNSVTLALSAQEAAMAAFVQEQGKIRILMRSNSDFDQASIKPVTWDTLFDYMYPEARANGAKPPATVEIYRGLQKDIVPLTGKTLAPVEEGKTK